jgi:hypothetical protein
VRLSSGEDRYMICGKEVLQFHVSTDPLERENGITKVESYDGCVFLTGQSPISSILINKYSGPFSDGTFGAKRLFVEVVSCCKNPS